LFGQAWADVDRNGCDTRNDILKRDLTAITFTSSVPCKVQTGTLADPYTGSVISFVRGRRRRRHLAATEQGFPLRIRRPADLGEGNGQPLGYLGGARRNAQYPG
jgi:hypothetical protein